MRTAAGIVLDGGRSTRMGEPKAGMSWHGSTLLYRPLDPELDSVVNVNTPAELAAARKQKPLDHACWSSAARQVRYALADAHLARALRELVQVVLAVETEERCDPVEVK